MSSKIGLREVAESAGVSLATVSRVANGHPRVDVAIQERVRTAARKLGLDLTKTRKSRALAFLLGNRKVLNEFQARLLVGIETHCTRAGWDLLFLSLRSDLWQPNAPVTLPALVTRTDRPAGVILGGTHTAAMLTGLDQLRLPYAAQANNVVGEWDPACCDCVWSDDISGAEQLTKYLIAQGHRTICYIGNHRLPWYARCGLGYRSAMDEAGLEPSIAEMYTEGWELGYLTTKSLLAGRRTVTAIFAGNDETAGGVYRALAELGVRVPADISVIGFNDTIGSTLYPALTTGREFPEQLGQKLAELVIRRIQNPAAEPLQISISTQPVLRESVRPVAG